MSTIASDINLALTFLPHFYRTTLMNVVLYKHEHGITEDLNQVRRQMVTLSN